MLVDEEDVMLEAGVEMCFEAELSNDGIVVAIDVGVDTIHSFKNLADHT